MIRTKTLFIAVAIMLGVLSLAGGLVLFLSLASTAPRPTAIAQATSAGRPPDAPRGDLIENWTTQDLLDHLERRGLDLDVLQREKLPNGQDKWIVCPHGYSEQSALILSAYGNPAEAEAASRKGNGAWQGFACDHFVFWGTEADLKPIRRALR